MTGAVISGATVKISYEGSTPDQMTTDSNGQVLVPSNGNGLYEATVTHPLYISNEGSTSLQCLMSNGCQCDTDFVITLDQERCVPENMANPVMMPVSVKDNLTNIFITGAKVSVFLTGSISGQSLLPVGVPLYTDSDGEAQFLISMNGDYSVSVSADGYISNEVDININCNTAHCESCAPTAPIALNKDFCQDKTLKLIVRDAQTNNPLAGASVSTTIDFYNGPREISSLITSETGVVEIPIRSNGVYEATVTMDGYISYSTSFEIDVTNDQCLTYYCDGKDPCEGVTFDVDNQNGGDSGTETITYCTGSEGYSNMVYIDDLSGEGATLLSSSARLVITSNERTQEIVLNTTQTADNA